MTAEAQHWWRAARVAPIGAAVFVDAARTGRRPSALADRRPLMDADAGVGFRLALPGRRGLFSVDFAHGLRDGNNAVSVRWRPDR
jgi:hypothetical protein